MDGPRSERGLVMTNWHEVVRMHSSVMYTAAIVILTS